MLYNNNNNSTIYQPTSKVKELQEWAKTISTQLVIHFSKFSVFLSKIGLSSPSFNNRTFININLIKIITMVINDDNNNKVIIIIIDNNK